MAALTKNLILLAVVLAPIFLASVSNGVIVQRKSTRMSRMPVYYGKRSVHFSTQKDFQNPNIYKRTNCLDSYTFKRMFGAIGYSRHYAIQTGDMWKEGPQHREALACLFNAVPTLFHKKIYFPWRKLQETQSLTFPRKRSSIPVIPEFHVSNNNDNVETRTHVLQIHHLPIYPATVLFSVFNLMLRRDLDSAAKLLKRNSIRRMPNFYGKRANDGVNTHSKYSRPNIDKNLVKSSELSYIFRTISEIGPTPELVAASDKLQRATSLSLLKLLGQTTINHRKNDKADNENDNNFDKRSSKIFTNDNAVLQEIARNKHKTDDIEIRAKSQDNSGSIDSFVSKRRYLSSLDRMPHYFGKRNHYSYIAPPTIDIGPITNIR